MSEALLEEQIEGTVVPEIPPEAKDYERALVNADELLRTKIPFAQVNLAGWKRENFEEKAKTLDVLADFLSAAPIDPKKLAAIQLVDLVEGTGSSLDLESGVFLLGSDTSENQLMQTFGVGLGEQPAQETPASLERKGSTIGDLENFLNENFPGVKVSVTDPELQFEGTDLSYKDREGVLIPSIARLIKVLEEGTADLGHSTIKLPRRISLKKDDSTSYNEEAGTLFLGSRASEEAIVEALKMVEARDVQEVEEVKAESGHELIGDFTVYTSRRAADLSSAAEVAAVKTEIEAALGDLSESERSLLQEKGFHITVRDSEVLYPVFKERQTTLDVGVGEIKDHIIHAIRNTVIPTFTQAETEQNSRPDPNLIRPKDPNALDPEVVEGGAPARAINAKEEPEAVPAIEASDTLSDKKLEAAVVLMEKVNEEYVQKKGWRLSIEKFATRAKESELMRTILANKAVKGYLKLNKYQRFALTTALIAGGAAALAPVGILGAVGTAGGVIGTRLIRGVGSFGGAGGMGIIGAKRLEKLDKKHAEELAVHDARQDISEETKVEARKLIQEKHEEDRKKMESSNKKMVVAAGIVGGFGAGAFEHLMNAGAEEVAEAAIAARPRASETLAKAVEKQIAFEASQTKVHIDAGDSVWGSLREVLEKNDRFAHMTKPQQETVIANLYNVVDDDPTKYGIGADGVIHPGDELDFSKLFEDTDRTGKIFDHSIKIHPEYAEVAEASVEEVSAEVENPKEKLVSFDELEKQAAERARAADRITHVEPWEAELPHDTGVGDVPLQTHPQTGPVMQGAGVIGGAVFAKKLARNESVSADPELENTFANGINAIYGTKGVLGFGGKEGVSSGEWRMIKGLSMPVVLKYYQGDSAAADLKPEIIQALSKSEKHYALMEELKEMMADSKGALKPFDNETVEDFLKRALGFRIKQSAEVVKTLPLAA